MTAVRVCVQLTQRWLDGRSGRRKFKDAAIVLSPRDAPDDIFSMGTNMRTLACLSICVLLTGCGSILDDQVKKSNGKVLGKTTQDIQKFDPNAKQEVSDSKVRIDTNDITAPVTGPLQAYGPALEQISKTHIKHALDLFNATEGRYPNSYEEFMDKIIKENNIQLPVLPFGHKYQYDVANHELVVVKPPAEAPAGNAPAAM